MLKKYYTTYDLARLLNLSPRTLVDYRQRIPGASRVGRQWRFDSAIIDKYIALGRGALLLKK